MATRRKPRSKASDELFRAKETKRIPFDFVLDELGSLDFETKPLFGCTAVYVGERIVLALRDKRAGDGDDGVWIATTTPHHEALRPLLPSMRSIGVLGSGVTGWQVLPSASPTFEEDVLAACALIRAGDPRIGKIPAPKRPRRKA